MQSDTAPAKADWKCSRDGRGSDAHRGGRPVKVSHCNISKTGAEPYGMTKYEDRLAHRLESLDVAVDRCQRSTNPILGTTPISWLLSYRQGDADLVHATFQTVAPAAYVHQASPFVVTVHDVAPLVYPAERSDLSVRLQWRVTPRALEYADRIVAISAFTKRELCRLTGVDPSAVRVVHQGVDHDRYRPLGRADSRERFDLNPETTYILVVSSDEPHKRTTDAIDVLEAVNTKLEGDVALLKAGYGKGLDHSNVVSTGWVPEADMPALYSAADVYLHTSEYEGFGLPVLEAMACGTPVVARDVASIPEIVDDVYELVPVDADLDALADRVVEQCREDPGTDERAVERSLAFSWERTARETREVYEEVLDT